MRCYMMHCELEPQTFSGGFGAKAGNGGASSTLSPSGLVFRMYDTRDAEYSMQYDMTTCVPTAFKLENARSHETD
jgi:hypothetical protein